MVQTGDFENQNGTGGKSIWGKEFPDEISEKVKYDRPGLLGMANRGPGTNGSQFFITTVKTPWLDKGHTIFGEVTKGYEVVKAIEAQGTQQGMPKEEMKILKVYPKPE